MRKSFQISHQNVEETKTKVCLTVTIEDRLFKEIEELRGREKRSTFVNHLLELGLEKFKEEIMER